MTAMFCDVVGSTPLAEMLDVEDFREVIGGYQQACSRAIARFDGHTAKYTGDGVVAYFGFPRAHEDDAQRAVHAALGILDELAVLNARLRDELDVALEVRIGLHTGTVIAEETDTAHLDITGEMPNIASRLESIAPPGAVVISDVTHGFVDGYFETEPLGAKELKGVSRPIGVHRVLRPTGAVGRLEVATARRLTPVIDRVHERALLADAWSQAEGGHGAVVHVSGEAGIGKSRVVHALIDDLGARVRAVRSWQCSAHHQSTPLHPVAPALEWLPAPDAGLDPRDARLATLRNLEALLVADPATHPLLLVVEDVHWADPTTLELLGRIVASVRSLPVLCVLTFRPELIPPWAGRRPAVDVALGPLSPGDVRAMAAAAAGAELAPTVLASVESAADGVPLFVEEMLKMLEHGDGPVPATLEGLLTERLDRLPALGDVIDVAAVLGREFDRPLLDALNPLGGAELAPALDELAAQDVLRPAGGTRWEFSHALLQEAAYERILRRRRQALHDQVASTLAAGFAGVAEDQPEVVAHHFSCAGRPAEATAFWHAAGTRALERAAYEEAAEHFRHGLESFELAPGDDLEEGELLSHLGASLQAARGYAAAGVDDAYAKARRAYSRAGSDDRLASVIRGEWMFHLLRARYGTALALADEMLAFGERGDQAVRQAEGELYRGLVHMYRGELGAARAHLEAAYTLHRRPDPGDHVRVAQGDTGVGALAYLSLVLWNLGHPGEAARRSDLSLERAEAARGPVARAQAWGVRSLLHFNRAEPDDLARWVRRTLTHSVDHDLGYWRAVSSLLGGWLRGRAGDLEGGTRHMEASLDAYLASGSRLGLANFLILLSELRLLAGDRDGALAELHTGERHVEETGERCAESDLFYFKARVLMAGDAPDAAGATAAYERAVRAAREQDAKMLELRAATRLAAHQGRLGEPCTGLDRLATLCDWFGPDAELPDVARARMLVKGAVAR